MSSTTLIRVLVLLNGSLLEEWEIDVLRQQKKLLDQDEEKRSTGLFPRYPKKDVDMFCHVRYRFICKEENIWGDAYIVFIDNLFEPNNKPEGITLSVIPNDHSGGIDFYKAKHLSLDKKDLNLTKEELKKRKADWRWFPLPLPDNLPIEKKFAIPTYVVFHHPDYASNMIFTGEKYVDSSSYYMPNHRYLRGKKDISMTGVEAHQCSPLFTGKEDTLGIKELLQFISQNPPT